MAEPTNAVNLTPYADEQAQIARRRRMAEILQGQSLAPIEQQTAGGWVVPISPWQGAARLAQGLLAGKMQGDTDAQQRQLGERARRETAEYLRGMPQGTPAVAPQQFDVGDAPATAQQAMGTPAQPASQQDRLAWALRGATSGNPFTQAVAAPMLTHAMKMDDPYSLREGEIRMGPGGQQIANNPKTHPLHFGNLGDSIQPMNAMTGAHVGPATPTRMTPQQTTQQAEDRGWGDPYEQGGAMVQKNSITGQVRQVVARPAQTRITNNNPPAVTTARVVDPTDPSRMIEVDARTYRGGSLGSPGVIGVSGRESDPQKREGKRQFNMQGIGKTIQEAEDLLTGRATGNAPTGSGIGAGVDFLGRAVGRSPKGAKEATTLEAVGGALVTKMPRMEGPQSDRDTILYKEMAAKVGDRTVPVAERLMALEKVKDLWATYERLNPDAFAGGQPASPATPPPSPPQRRSTDKPRRYNPATGQIE